MIQPGEIDDSRSLMLKSSAAFRDASTAKSKTRNGACKRKGHGYHCYIRNGNDYFPNGGRIDVPHNPFADYIIIISYIMTVGLHWLTS